MNQIDTSISYMSYTKENDFVNHNVNDHKRKDKKLTYPMGGQFFGLILPEANKQAPINVTLFDENRMNRSDEIMNNENSINSTFEIYPESKLNQFPSVPRYNDKTMMPMKSVAKTGTCTRSRWTKEEEDTLMDLVKKAGPRKWNQIAAILKTKTAKQCRDHYANCLDPEIRNSLWTDEEERLLLTKYQEYGPHWSRIKKFLPGRTTSIIKNYVTMLIKKNERGLSNDLHYHNPTYQVSNVESEEASSSCISNPGSDTDDQNFTLNMTDEQSKYNNFTCLDINCLLNRPQSGLSVI